MLALSKPFIGEEELDAVKKVFESGCLAGTCPVVGEFEEKFANTVEAKHGIACSSATVGLHAALIACGIKKGDEVIVADFSHPASAFAVLHCGAKTIFADITIDTYCIDPDDIKKKITERTKVIMPIYQFGLPCDIDVIHKIAEDSELRVVWDAATGLGSRYKNIKAGSFSECEIFSMFPTKIIATGEGGMVTTNNEEIAEIARSIVHFGKIKTKFTRVGYNYRLSAIHAAIGICQLEKLPAFIRQRQELAEYYKKRINEEVNSLYWLCPQYEHSDRKSAWQRFVCIASHKRHPHLRNDTIAYMKKQGIECGDGNYALHLLDVFADTKHKCPNSAFAYYHSISLPLHCCMTIEDVDYVIEKLLEFHKSYPF